MWKLIREDNGAYQLFFSDKCIFHTHPYMHLEDGKVVVDEDRWIAVTSPLTSIVRQPVAPVDSVEFVTRQETQELYDILVGVCR